jgi:glutamyl/glutaminyl-tRNA synthetase
MARSNPGYIEHEKENFTGARPKRPTMPLRMQHQPSQPESLLTPPALEDLPPDVYRKPSRPQRATSTDHLMSPCYAIRLMQAQIDDRYSTMDEVRQAAADSATVANNGYFAMDNQISTTTPHKITKLEADVIMLTTQLLDLGDKWNYFATKYSEAKDQLVAAKLHSEQISNLLQEATARLHEAELDKTLTQFHLKLSESATAYYKNTCDEFKDKLEDVVKTIKERLP